MNKIEKFLGKSWEEFFKNANVQSDCDTEKLNTHISKLKFKDLIHYGHYTSAWHQNFDLVVCEVCSQAILPQAFLRHFQKRHINSSGSNETSVRSNTHLQQQQQAFKGTNESGINNGSIGPGGSRKRQCGSKRVGLHNHHHDADYEPPVATGRRKRERLKQQPPPVVVTTCGQQELGAKGLKQRTSTPDPIALSGFITTTHCEDIRGTKKATTPPLSLNVTFPIITEPWLQERLDQAPASSPPPLPSLKIVLRKISSGASSSHSPLPAPPTLPQRSPSAPPPSTSPPPPSFQVVVSPTKSKYALIEDEELPLALLLSRRRRHIEQEDEGRKRDKRSQRIRRLEKARASLEHQIRRLKTDLSMGEEAEPNSDSSRPPNPDPPPSSPPPRLTRRVPILNRPTIVDGSRFADSASRLQPLAYDLSSLLPIPTPLAPPLISTDTPSAPSPPSSLGGGSSSCDRASSYTFDSLDAAPQDSAGSSSSSFTNRLWGAGSPCSPGGSASPAPRYKHPDRHLSTDLACFAPFQHAYPGAAPSLPAGVGATPLPPPPPAYLTVEPGGSLPFYPHLYGVPKLSNRGSGNSTPSSHHNHHPHHNHAPKFAQKRQQKSVHEMALFQKILELNSLAVESHHTSLDKDPCFKPSIIGPNHAPPIGFSALSPSYKT